LILRLFWYGPRDIYSGVRNVRPKLENYPNRNHVTSEWFDLTGAKNDSVFFLVWIFYFLFWFRFTLSVFCFRFISSFALFFLLSEFGFRPVFVTLSRTCLSQVWWGTECQMIWPPNGYALFITALINFHSFCRAGLGWKLKMKMEWLKWKRCWCDCDWGISWPTDYERLI